mmetsp:Transcript_32279/g.52681  ORF Transcript_32279/g.52681 Transcript_32279/m.52681 type:complete len:361 (-) Transcript_32279:445-1527(-)|eukprot:CAMPEP_0194577476 /NCGR_PEP_ID=MMETSP0292-20121207/12253_1 /TAXON_ID=39354 /ORGANISM="Heterosigma akashiwo, Strain CCMP2393" /LENGTH=360 /DNA_ID=CAMNT_0039429887 /DNA_START=44 /DNA_END=1126 /DNA_ORIENTATION=-
MASTPLSTLLLLHLLHLSEERQVLRQQPEMPTLLAELITTTQEGYADILRRNISSSSGTTLLLAPSLVQFQLAAAATGGGLLQQPLLQNTSSLAPSLLSRASTTHSRYNLLQNISSSVPVPLPFQSAAATGGLLQQPLLPNTSSMPLGASTSLANNAVYSALLALKASGHQMYTRRSNEALGTGSSAVLPSLSTLLDSHHGLEESLPRQTSCNHYGFLPTTLKGPIQEDYSPSTSDSNSSGASVGERNNKREDEQSFRMGTWTEAEHRLFLKGLAEIGPGNWIAISKTIPTRTAVQTRSHAQKYFNKLEKKKHCSLSPKNLSPKRLLQKQNLFKKRKVYPADDFDKEKANKAHCKKKEES